MQDTHTRKICIWYCGVCGACSGQQMADVICDMCRTKRRSLLARLRPFQGSTKRSRPPPPHADGSPPCITSQCSAPHGVLAHGPIPSMPPPLQRPCLLHTWVTWRPVPCARICWLISSAKSSGFVQPASNRYSTLHMKLVQYTAHEAGTVHCT